MSVLSKETIVQFAAVGGSYVDFQKIDLSPWGIQGGLIESEETEKFIRSISMDKYDERNWLHLRKVTQETFDGSGKHGDWEHINLLFPLDIKNAPEEKDYFEAIEAIRVIHPSEVYIRNVLDAQYFEDQGIFFGSWSTYEGHYWYKYEKPQEHYFSYPEKHLNETNEFLALFKKRYGSRDYIRNAIKYYSDSFQVNSIEMSFICLCICLETIVPGQEQLAYRFRRNLSVLCSDSVDAGRKIYERANQLYKKRSKLVHSGMNRKDFSKFDLFYEYAQILASRMIIEMLLHDLPTIEDLDNKITTLGYGEKNQISDGYQEFKGNIAAWFKVSEYLFD